MKHKLIVVLFIFLMLPMSASALPIDASLTGSRSVGSGIDATNGTKGVDGWLSKGFNLSWNITQTGSIWNYSYTLDPLGNGGVSHMILEVSPFITDSNWTNYIYDFSPNLTVVAPTTYAADSGGNPNLPTSIYGIKFDFGGNPITYSFKSTQRPVYGDFYTKDGAFGEAWNTGIGTDPIASNSPFTNWIATPDTTTTPMPEPMTVLLLGAGLASLGFMRRRMK